MIILALPRLVGAILLLPFDKARSSTTPSLSKRYSPDREISGRFAVLKWIDDSNVWKDIGSAYINKARTKGIRTKAGKTELLRAKNALYESLKRAPANPFSWANLAYVDFLIDRRSKLIEHSLNMSLANGEYEPRLVLSRLGIALMIWDQLSIETKKKFTTQVDLATKISPKRLDRIVERTRSFKIVENLINNIVE
jgi:hypothetical protein